MRIAGPLRDVDVGPLREPKGPRRTKVARKAAVPVPGNGGPFYLYLTTSVIE
jgi:hypothetical protein